MLNKTFSVIFKHRGSRRKFPKAALLLLSFLQYILCSLFFFSSQSSFCQSCNFCCVYASHVLFGLHLAALFVLLSSLLAAPLCAKTFGKETFFLSSFTGTLNVTIASHSSVHIQTYYKFEKVSKSTRWSNMSCTTYLLVHPVGSGTNEKKLFAVAIN